VLKGKDSTKDASSEKKTSSEGKYSLMESCPGGRQKGKEEGPLDSEGGGSQEPLGGAPNNITGNKEPMSGKKTSDFENASGGRRRKSQILTPIVGGARAGGGRTSLGKRGGFFQ